MRQPDGVGPGQLATIERETFVYFVTMARELGQPGDWAAFRDELVRALNAAWGLDSVWADLDREAQRRYTAERFRRAYALVDEVRIRHDPVAEWDGFFEALWRGRAPLLEDLDV